jgi:hypothetical protein
MVRSSFIGLIQSLTHCPNFGDHRRAPEHPGWEDLIELKNIEAEIKEIANDIKVL